MVSHPEPDILECEVKWALRSPAVNKASECDEILAELFKSLKDEPSRFLWQHIWKLSMQDFKHDLISKGDECNCTLVSIFFATTLLGNWDED